MMLTKNQTEHYQWAASVGREARDMQPIGFEDYRRAAVCILSLEAENAALRDALADAAFRRLSRMTAQAVLGRGDLKAGYEARKDFEAWKIRQTEGEG